MALMKRVNLIKNHKHPNAAVCGFSRRHFPKAQVRNDVLIQLMLKVKSNSYYHIANNDCDFKVSTKSIQHSTRHSIELSVDIWEGGGGLIIETLRSNIDRSLYKHTKWSFNKYEIILEHKSKVSISIMSSAAVL